MTAKPTGKRDTYDRAWRNGRNFLGAALSALLMSAAACTAILNHQAAQCQTDNDCAAFGDHPYCQAGVCVSSGLGPTNCFYGTPQQPDDFLNQCSNAQCLSFGDYDASALDSALVDPPVPDAGTSSSSSAPADDAGPPTLPSCSDSAGGKPIYITGSSNFPTLLAKLAPIIVSQTGYTPVYLTTNSCTGVSSVFSSETIKDPAPFVLSKSAVYFNATTPATGSPCLLGQPVSVDVGESDIFSTTCSATSVPGAAVTEYLGPVQAMVFAVPGASLQTAITVNQAREVFGMGGPPTASPWTNPFYYFVRSSGTGTQQMIGHAIGVPATNFWGNSESTATVVDQDLRQITDPTKAQQAIGILSADVYDGDRGNVKALAYEAPDQECAYLPDSNAFKKDKQNVRDGHYPIWGPVHFFTSTAGGLTAGAQAFVGSVSVPSPSQQLTDAFIQSSMVPSCAMSVQRQDELGPLSTYSPPVQCYCHFQALVDGIVPPGCTPCPAGAVQCTNPARPACNLGYCEVQ
jgi:hypothetical protein